MNNFDNFCRICLSKASIPIFDTTRDEYRDIGRNLSICLCEKIEDIDGYPRNICETCYTTVNDIIAFHNKYKESCELLKQSLELRIKQEFEDLSNHSIELSDVDLASVKSESKIVFRDAEQFKELIQPLVTNVKEKPKIRKMVHTKSANKKANVKKQPRPSKKSRRKPIAKAASKNNNNKTNSCKPLNSRISSSILEGDFVFTGEQWCLKPPKKDTKAKTKEINQKIEMKLDKKPKTVKENVSPTCDDVPMQKSQKQANETRLCEHCGGTFDNIEHLKRHVNKVHLKNTSTCPTCSKVLSDKACLIRHIKRCHSKVSNFFCPVCGKGFMYQNEVTQHHKYVHLKYRPESTKKFACKLCDKKYVTAKSLLIHERAVHTGERPAACTVCDARFTHEDYLKEHMRLHTGETPFKCPVCGRGYAQRCNMRSHVHHVHRISDLDELTRKTIKPIYLRLMKP